MGQCCKFTPPVCYERTVGSKQLNWLLKEEPNMHALLCFKQSVLLCFKQSVHKLMMRTNVNSGVLIHYGAVLHVPVFYWGLPLLCIVLCIGDFELCLPTCLDSAVGRAAA